MTEKWEMKDTAWGMKRQRGKRSGVSAKTEGRLVNEKENKQQILRNMSFWKEWNGLGKVTYSRSKVIVGSTLSSLH